MNPLQTLQRLARVCSLNQTDLNNTLDELGLETPADVSTTTIDGQQVKVTKTAFTTRDLSIPIGSWKLRLIPTEDSGNSVRVPIELRCNDNSGSHSFRDLRVEVARFEMESDPKHLAAADLKTKPNIHLVKSRAKDGKPVPVRILGPGMVMIFAGAELDDMDLELRGAEGASSPEFPSLRCEPPHFIFGNSDIGAVCDEVLLDHKRDANPDIVDEKLPDAEDSWRGFILKELGVFIGDGSEVGTWSGTAMMKDFFIGLDGVDLSGKFIGELVHYVLEDEPQIQVAVSFKDQNGNETNAALENDVVIPAPAAGKDFVYVRLVARPNWDSAGFRVSWTLPPGVSIEEPHRRTSLNLGWVKVPANGGDHTFTVTIEDHRIDPDRSASRTVRVLQAAAPADPNVSPYKPTLEAILLDGPYEEGFRPTNRLHVALRPGEKALIRAQVWGPTGNSVNAELSESTTNFFEIFDSSPIPGPEMIQTLDALPGTAEWEIGIPANATPGDHAALILEVRDGNPNNTLQRRLRVTVAEPIAENHRNFDLVTYNDWRADVGIGQAHVRLHNGMDFGDIEWTLDSHPVTTTLFTDVALDGLFNGAVYDHSHGELALPNSAGTVRPDLHTDSRLWRLIGRAPAGTEEVWRPAVVVGTVRNANVLHDPKVIDFIDAPQQVQNAPNPELTQQHQVTDGSTVRAIQFRYDCPEIQPGTSGAGKCFELGPEDPPMPFTQADTLQATGFAALFRALAAYGTAVEQIGLFGSASIEGDIDYNLNLAANRAANVKAELLTPSPELTAAMAQLPEADRLTAIPQAAIDVIATLGPDNIITEAFGEKHANTSPHGETAGPADPNSPEHSGYIDATDRHVFAILKLKPALTGEEVKHVEYFVTLPDAPPPSETPEVPRGKLQRHPFRHSIFRKAHVEFELLHNSLRRFMIYAILDIRAFNTDDTLADAGANPNDPPPLNEQDGLVTMALELKRNPDAKEDEPSYRWEAVLLADPRDRDGLAAANKQEDPNITGYLGPAAISTPALTALSGGRVGIQALIGGLAAGALFSELGIIDVQTLVWRGIRFRVLHGNVEQVTVRAGVDYTVKYHVDANLAELTGIPLLPNLSTKPDKPLEITFRNVGVEIRQGSTNVEFFYDPKDGFMMDVNDPGVFQLGDGIGRLLNVKRVRTGAGSPLWLEVELGLALETGIFAVDTLRIRLSLEMDKLFEANVDGVVTLSGEDLQLSDLDASINKFGVGVNVPGVLEGRGEFGLNGANGEDAIEGAMDLKVVPTGWNVEGAIKVYSEADFRALFTRVGVEFAPGIPLGTTGAAVYGLSGLVGVNMTRSMEQPLPWFKANPIGVASTSKWTPERGNWAFGMGTVIGTAYDNGHSFNTKGSFILEVPGPKFLLATESNFIRPKPAVTSAETGSLLSTVLLDFENDLLQIGLDFTYVKENLLEFRVPTDVFFNLADADDWHIRFGQWLPETKRITMRVFNAFDAWGYLNLEGDGSQITAPLDLHGVSLALGGRIEVFWGAKPLGVYLEAFAETHVGLQFDPLLFDGSLTVGGELHLIVATLGASGNLRVIAPDPFVLSGSICGKLDLWLFSIEGCADFTIGDGSATTPDPESPFQEIVLIDRMTSGAVQAGEPEDIRAPLDVVLHAIFNQDIIDRRPEPGLVLTSAPLRNQVSNDLYYDYYLDSLRLVQLDENDNEVDVVDPMPSAWAPYSLPNAEPEVADSTRTLRVLDWQFSSHTRALDFSHEYGQTLTEMIARICEPLPPPDPDCATFDQEPAGIGSYWELTDDPLTPVEVISTLGDGLGAETLGELFELAAAAVVPMVPVSYTGRIANDHCLRLPSIPAAMQLTEPLEDIVSALAGAIGQELEGDLAELWRSGIVFVHLPDLVMADIILIAGQEVQTDGQVVFLDSEFSMVTPVQNFADLPLVASSGTGSFIQHVARRAAFGPPSVVETNPQRVEWLVIKAPGNMEIAGIDPYAYVSQLCGITFGAWHYWQTTVESRTEIIQQLEILIGVSGADPALGSFDLLEPNTKYRLAGDLRWARFRSENGSHDDGTGSFSFDRTFRTVADAPTDIRRYVAGHSPVSDAYPQYYAEPVEILFASDVIDKLFAKFGKQLVARIKADAKQAETEIGEHTLNQPLRAETLVTEYIPIGSWEETIVEALDALDDSCTDGNWEELFPKEVFRTADLLKANTGYTLSLLPRPLGEPENMGSEAEWNRLLQADFDQNRAVFRLDLRTSRFASFSEHVGAYRTAPILDIFGDDGAALDAALAVVSDGQSNEAVDALCVALFGGPLGLPSAAPYIARIWVPDAGAASGYRCRALLLDGPEPLLKPKVGGSPRVALEARQTPDETTPFASGTSLDNERQISSVRGARTFILFDTPAAPPVVQIELVDRPDGTLPQSTEHLVIVVGDTPASFS